MSASGNLKSMAYSAHDRAQNMNNFLHSEVYGGSWNDEVGSSYLSYTDNLRRYTDNFISAAENVARIENELASIDEKADRAKLEKIKSMVQSV